MKNKLPIDQLVEEHRVIMNVIDAMSVMAAALLDGKAIEPPMLLSTVIFMKTYAGKCHQGKEEGYLFPLLQTRGVSTNECSVRVLLREHQAEQKLIGSLMEATQAYAAKNSRETRTTLAGVFQQVINHYPAHVRKEAYFVFPLANKVLSDEDNQNLLQGFAIVDTAIGRAKLDVQEAWAESLNTQLRNLQ